MRVAKASPTPAAPPPLACAVCTTPLRCGTPSWRTVKGPRCAGKANGPDRCDCDSWCGDDPRLRDGRAEHCDDFKARQARAAALQRQTEAHPVLLALARRVAGLDPTARILSAELLDSLISVAQAAIAPFESETP